MSPMVIDQVIDQIQQVHGDEKCGGGVSLRAAGGACDDGCDGGSEGGGGEGNGGGNDGGNDEFWEGQV